MMTTVFSPARNLCARSGAMVEVEITARGDQTDSRATMVSPLAQDDWTIHSRKV
jgi:hypothetical protein